MEKLSKVRGEISCTFPGGEKQSAMFDTGSLNIAGFRSLSGETLQVFLWLKRGKGGLCFYLSPVGSVKADRHGLREFNFPPEQKGFKIEREVIPLLKNSQERAGEVTVDLNFIIIS